MTYSPRPLFSIVIPTYNYGHYLPDAVQSVLQQPGNDYELIIINDGSTDDTDVVIRQLSLEHPHRFRYYHQDNQGPSGTRNRGIQLAQGRYILFLDSDDQLTPNALTGFRAATAQQSQAAMIIGRYQSVRLDGTVKERGLWSLTDSKEGNFVQYLLNTNITLLCSAVLFKKTAFRHCQFPSAIKQFEDVVVFAHLFAHFQVAKITTIVARVRQHADSLRHQVCPELSNCVVDTIFNPQHLPAALMRHKTRYYGILCLEQCRTLYLAGQYAAAWQQYRQAFAYNKRAALQLNFLRKAIKSWLKK